jgi:O-acetyl-ADP-ribose deacetylase (regulator of RNase III)
MRSAIDKLYGAYENSLKIAKQNNITSIAFPGLSIGIFGCDKKEAAIRAVISISRQIPSGASKGNPIKDIYLTAFGDKDYKKALIDEFEKGSRSHFKEEE